VTALGDNKYSVYGNDFNFGTMGGFRWNVEELPDGKFKFIAEDVWDLNPISRLPLLPKSIKNLDLGTKLGIGKPLNVKVGFLYDPTKDRILETFEDGGMVNKYLGGGETKYYTTIDESGGNTPSQPKTKDELGKVSKFLLGLLAETVADQMPGKVGEAYKHGKVGYELYNQGIIPSIVEGAKVPVPYYGDLLMNFLNNNPWYNSYDLDKKLFGSSSPRGFIDSDIKPSKKKSKS